MTCKPSPIRLCALLLATLLGCGEREALVFPDGFDAGRGLFAVVPAGGQPRTFAIGQAPHEIEAEPGDALVLLSLSGAQLEPRFHQARSWPRLADSEGPAIAELALDQVWRTQLGPQGELPAWSRAEPAQLPASLLEVRLPILRQSACARLGGAGQASRSLSELTTAGFHTGLAIGPHRALATTVTTTAGPGPVLQIDASQGAVSAVRVTLSPPRAAVTVARGPQGDLWLSDGDALYRAALDDAGARLSLSFTASASEGGPTLDRLAVGAAADGSTEVFAVSRAGALSHWREGDGAFTPLAPPLEGVSSKLHMGVLAVGPGEAVAWHLRLPHLLWVKDGAAREVPMPAAAGRLRTASLHPELGILVGTDSGDVHVFEGGAFAASVLPAAMPGVISILPAGPGFLASSQIFGLLHHFRPDLDALCEYPVLSSVERIVTMLPMGDGAPDPALGLESVLVLSVSAGDGDEDLPSARLLVPSPLP